MRSAAGTLDRFVAFDRPVRASNGAGGSRTGWTELFEAYAEFRYQAGGEEDQGGGLSVAARFKVRIHSHAQSRALSGEDTLRDVVTGDRYNIRQIDAVSDPAFVWLVAEAGVAS